MNARTPTQCMHAQWCNGEETGPHDPTCPRIVLAMSLSDVKAFNAEYVRMKSNRLANGRLVLWLEGNYHGLRATVSIEDSEPVTRQRRWLAENLLMHARLGTGIKL